MATKYLINNVRGPGGVFTFAGSSYDDVNDAAQIAALVAGGGVLVPSTPIVATAAGLAQQMHQAGGDVNMIAGIMLAASAGAADAAAIAAAQATADQAILDAAAAQADATQALADAATAETDAQQGITDAAAAQADATQALADAAAAQTDATQALADAASAQATANAAVPKASVQTGTGTLVAGVLAVGSANITASSVIIPIRDVPDPVAANLGDLSITAPTPGTPGSFNVQSANGADTSTVRWLVIG